MLVCLVAFLTNSVEHFKAKSSIHFFVFLFFWPVGERLTYLSIACFEMASQTSLWFYSSFWLLWPLQWTGHQTSCTCLISFCRLWPSVHIRLQSLRTAGTWGLPPPCQRQSCAWRSGRSAGGQSGLWRWLHRCGHIRCLIVSSLFCKAKPYRRQHQGKWMPSLNYSVVLSNLLLEKNKHRRLPSKLQVSDAYVCLLV